MAIFVVEVEAADRFVPTIASMNLGSHSKDQFLI
jgi:hypothetical protein